MAATRNKRSTDPVDAVAACLVPRLSRGGRVCVALSGGRDSVALLHALVALRDTAQPKLTLSALHVHHGISRFADDWATFCAGLCADLQVPFRCERVTVDRGDPAGLEAAARAARYRVFSSCDADWLLLAHHRDDQAETLLLNLLRGAGVHGLAGMPEERALGAGGPRLLRPLLGLPRQAIERWLTARCLPWVEDDSNDDTDLRRNFLRRQVLPFIGSQFPDPSRALSRAAGHLAEMAALADEVAMADARDVVAGNSLVLAAFNTLPETRRANVLRLLFRQRGLRMPDTRHVAEMLRQLAIAQPSAAPAFLVDGAICRVSRGRLWVCAEHYGGPLLPVPWHGAAEVPWAGGTVSFRPVVGQGVAQRMLQAAGRVELRPRSGGERLRIDSRRARRPLKKILQEADVPQWQRDTMPLLWCGETLVWAAGVGYADDMECVAAPGEPGWMLSWSMAGDFSGGQ